MAEYIFFGIVLVVVIIIFILLMKKKNRDKYISSGESDPDW